MTNTEAFAEKLKLLRISNNLSQKQLADKLGITAQSLSLYEKAERTINIDLLVKIAKYFNVSCDYLLGLTETQSYEADLQAAVKYTGLSEGAILSIKNMDKCKINFPYGTVETSTNVSKHKIKLFTELLEHDFISKMLSHAIEYAIDIIECEENELNFGKFRDNEDQQEFASFLFTKKIQKDLGDISIKYCKENAVYILYQIDHEEYEREFDE